MKRNFFLIGILMTSFSFAQVGINTTNPQEELHVAGAAAKVRIDGLSETNNATNLGANNSTRVFANADGDLILGSASNNINMIIDSANYLDDVEDPTNLVNQTGNAFGYDPAGIPTDLAGSIFTLADSAIVEVNYSVSWSVYKTNSPSGRIDDEHARIVQTGLYFRQFAMGDDPADPTSWAAYTEPGNVWCIDVNASGTVCQETGTMIALNGQFYNNADSKNGAYQNFQNTASDYIELPPGTYSTFFAAQLAVGSTSGTGAVKMYLGSGNDDLQIIAYYFQ